MVFGDFTQSFNGLWTSRAEVISDQQVYINQWLISGQTSW